MKKFKSFLIYFLFAVAFIVTAIFVLLEYGSRGYVFNASQSLDGYLFSGSKVTYKESMSFDYGEVVAFKTIEMQEQIDNALENPFDRKKRIAPFIKRVTGKPGDTVCYSSLGATVYPKGWDSVIFYTVEKAKLIESEACMVIPENRLFVTGDHVKSFDSRYFGLIDYQYIYMKGMKVVL